MQRRGLLLSVELWLQWRSRGQRSSWHRVDLEQEFTERPPRTLSGYKPACGFVVPGDATVERWHRGTPPHPRCQWCEERLLVLTDDDPGPRGGPRVLGARRSWQRTMPASKRPRPNAPPEVVSNRLVDYSLGMAQSFGTMWIQVWPGESCTTSPCAFLKTYTSQMSGRVQVTA